MTWRSAVRDPGWRGWSGLPIARRRRMYPFRKQPVQRPDASVQYLPLDAPAGMSQAVVVQDVPLVHTRQLLPLDRDGQLVGEGAVDAADRASSQQSGRRAERLGIAV